MKTFFLLMVAVIAVSQAVSFFDLVLEEWDTYKITHRKNYSSKVEEKFRMKIFMENKHTVAKHNAKYEMGLVSYKLGLNQFADMLHYEFVDMLNVFNKSTDFLTESGSPVGATFITPANVKIPESVDWRARGAVTAVKNQHRCGSCWAFSATGSLEGQHFRKTGKLVSLSEQNLIDCSGSYGNKGCDGGLPQKAFQYIKDNNGIDTEGSYPYEAHVNKCRYDPRNKEATDAGFVDISPGDEEKLKAAVGTAGPVAVLIDASHRSFQLYGEGIYDEAECSSVTLDHAVTAVGYGTDENGKDYWLVKNSWGERWGEKGYIKMTRNKNNQCGIAASASYPLV